MMQNRLYVIILLCILTLLGGCKKKKQAAAPTQPSPVEQNAPAAPAEPVTPVTPVAPPATQPVAEPDAPEVSPVADEPAAPEIRTLWIQRMTITFEDRGTRFSTQASLRWERNVGAIVSIQPFASIELMRAEVTPEQIILINKLSRSYAQADAEQVRKKYAIDLAATLDATVDRELLSRMDEPVIRIRQTQGQTTVEVAINTAYILLNENVNIQLSNIQGYKKVSAEQLLHTLL